MICFISRCSHQWFKTQNEISSFAFVSIWKSSCLFSTIQRFFLRWRGSDWVHLFCFLKCFGWVFSIVSHNIHVPHAPVWVGSQSFYFSLSRSSECVTKPRGILVKSGVSQVLGCAFVEVIIQHSSWRDTEPSACNFCETVKLLHMAWWLKV